MMRSCGCSTAVYACITKQTARACRLADQTRFWLSAENVDRQRSREVPENHDPSQRNISFKRFCVGSSQQKHWEYNQAHTKK